MTPARRDPVPNEAHGPRRLRAPEEWARGAAATVLLSFDVDAEAPILAMGEHHATDLSAMSHQAYGPLVGIPRILELLDRHGVPGTFFVPGVTAQRWPQAVRSIAGADHEIALHGHTHAPITDLDEEGQSTDLDLAVAALGELDIEPRGYRAPFWRQTEITLERIAGLGLLYDSSLMDADVPYRLALEGGEVAELPVHWSLDDWEQYAFLPEPDIGQRIIAPSRVAELWLEELEAMRATNSLCVLTAHPFLSGRPSRIGALDKFIRAAKSHGDVEFAKASQVAERVLDIDRSEGTSDR